MRSPPEASLLMKMVIAAAAAALLLGGCDWMDKKEPAGAKSDAELRAERDRRLRRACASEATYDRLKELAFDEAARIRRADPRELDALAAASVVRMEEPVATARDDDLNVTVCRGRFILELPPGVENAFDGERRLVADIEYAAQAAADGSGLVFHMEGAEPIVYRLATAGGFAPRTAEAPPQRQPAPQQAPEPQGVPAPEKAPPPATAEPREARTAASPSFNCNYARTRSERMVCGSNALAAKDRQMAALYYSVMANADVGTRAHMRRSRDAFLARRERCGSEDCVIGIYDARIREIRRIAAGE